MSHLSVPLTPSVSPILSEHNSTSYLMDSMTDRPASELQSAPLPSRSVPHTSTHIGVPDDKAGRSDDLAGQRNDDRQQVAGPSYYLPTSSLSEKPFPIENTTDTRAPQKEDDSLPLDTKTVWPPWKRRDGWSGWMSDTVTANALVMCLILQAFSTGILDATTYLDFSTFASNQTGNTILLTVAIVRVSGHLLLLTGVSLASFLGSAFVLAQIGHFVGVRRRVWLLLNVFFQMFCLTLAAILLSPHGPHLTRLGQKHEWVIISLFAIMSGAQVAAARQASIQEIPTAPMTSSYVDLVGDKYLFVPFGHENAGARNRRLAYITAMITGSFIGGIMHKYAGSWVVVVVAMAFKLAVVVLMCLAPADPPSKTKRSAC